MGLSSVVRGNTAVGGKTNRCVQSRYDNVTLSPLLLQRGLRFCPIQRNGLNGAN